MDKIIKFFVGLDVHKDTISIAVCEPSRESARFAGTIRHDVPTLLKVLRKYGEAAQVNVVYEAGPTGYGLYRELAGHGYQCQVIAPSLTPRRGPDQERPSRLPAPGRTVAGWRAQGDLDTRCRARGTA